MPEARVYPVLTHVAAWPRFWPRTRVTALGDDRFELVLGRPPRRLRLRLAAGAWRHDAGFTMRLGGDLVGRWEIWLDPTAAGTVVHHVLDARGATARLLPRFRGWVRGGLWGLKDELEGQALDALMREDDPPTGP